MHQHQNLSGTDLCASSPDEMCRSKQDSVVLETLIYVFINSGIDFWTHWSGWTQLHKSSSLWVWHLAQ